MYENYSAIYENKSMRVFGSFKYSSIFVASGAMPQPFRSETLDVK
jgi:hypothetical protein